MDQVTALRTTDLYRFYRAGDEEVLALRGVSIEVSAGEVVAVTGPSGSGKSTLMSCLAGLDEPDGGAVWVGGERISHRYDGERAVLRARHIGVLRQSDNLFDHLSVLDNVKLARRIAGGSATVGPDVLAAVGMGERGHHLPSQLSGGESARAAVAVALANDPVVLLADEPTGELDSETERQVLSLLRERAGAGTAVVIASHSPAVRRMADRVIALREGRIDG
ncbi:MAG: putative transport system ATP-binding protein [Frankiaceae bacterium]|jgi:putative ABC transport system ATP-binding protein|nr:putative transport system ATP-binding protein [Frankiaceae bacterium]